MATPPGGSPSTPISVAVIGGGVSGLGSAWALSQNPHVKLTIYEAEAKLGGHANTVVVRAMLPMTALRMDVGV